LTVAFIVIVDVPELVGPVPVAGTAKVSGPLYPGIRRIFVAGYVELFQGAVCRFFAILEICISPCILMENRQVSPEATLKKPVESAPQLDNVPDVGHSEAACADGIGAKLGAPPPQASKR